MKHWCLLVFSKRRIGGFAEVMDCSFNMYYSLWITQRVLISPQWKAPYINNIIQSIIWPIDQYYLWSGLMKSCRSLSFCLCVLVSVSMYTDDDEDVCYAFSSLCLLLPQHQSVIKVSLLPLTLRLCLYSSTEEITLINTGKAWSPSFTNRELGVTSKVRVWVRA